MARECDDYVKNKVAEIFSEKKTAVARNHSGLWTYTPRGADYCAAAGVAFSGMPSSFLTMGAMSVICALS